jgi:hypothetical protein
MTGGYRNNCKTCYNGNRKQARLNNIEHYREYIKIQSRLRRKTQKGREERRKQRKAQYNKDAEKQKAYASNYRVTYPERKKAHNIVNNAIRDEKITRPDACSICNSNTCIIQAHHLDYCKPLDVIWVCPSCHKEIHKNLTFTGVDEICV